MKLRKAAKAWLVTIILAGTSLAGHLLAPWNVWFDFLSWVGGIVASGMLLVSLIFTFEDDEKGQY